MCTNDGSYISLYYNATQEFLLCHVINSWVQDYFSMICQLRSHRCSSISVKPINHIVIYDSPAVVCKIIDHHPVMVLRHFKSRNKETILRENSPDVLSFASKLDGI